MDFDSEEECLMDTSDEEFSSSSSESESDDDLDNVRNWCEIDPTRKLIPPPKFPFSGNPGIKVPITDAEDPLEYFRLFFDENIISYIVEETNRFANNHLETAQLTPSSRSLKWEDVTEREMIKFIALLLLQGLVQKPVERWFWSKRPIINTPFFGKIMSQQQYSLMMKYLHFENSETFDASTHPNPKLRKIYDLHDMLTKNFKRIYIPEQEISIDESLLKYKGLLGWKQFIPTKRARFGIKLYQLCESKSGYIWHSIIYTGKDTSLNEKYKSPNSASNVVMSLMHDLLGHGYTLITDNFYTCPDLAEMLIKEKTDIYGTMRANRKNLPKLIKTKKLKKGEIVAFQKGKICVLKWQDKKPLCMLSTVHSTDSVEVASKRKSQKKPIVVVDYNKSMGGVDLSDQCLSYYKITRDRQRKYYKKIFRHLLDQAVWNSFVIFKKNGGSLTHLDFRIRLIERLIEDSGEIKSALSGGPAHRPSENVTRLTERHFPSFVSNSKSSRTHPVRKCVVCATKVNENGKRIRRESRFECEECNVGLCAAPCFKIYHTVHVI